MIRGAFTIDSLTPTLRINTRYKHNKTFLALIFNVCVPINYFMMFAAAVGNLLTHWIFYTLLFAVIGNDCDTGNVVKRLPLSHKKKKTKRNATTTTTIDRLTK
jgi:hypothetical protein